jgi:hypothetical protein
LPDEHWQGEETAGHPVEVDCWNPLHFQDARHISVSVLRVVRPAAKGTKRDPRVSWFLFEGQQRPPLAEVSPLYALRYSLEHGYQVDKQDLLWQSPRLRTPEQFQHWTDVVASARNQLYLARPLAEEALLPWEKIQRPATPQQIRRVMGRILADLGTPAKHPHLRGNSPGRPKGMIPKPAPRFPVVYKATDKPIQLV